MFKLIARLLHADESLPPEEALWSPSGWSAATGGAPESLRPAVLRVITNATPANEVPGPDPRKAA